MSIYQDFVRVFNSNQGYPEIGMDATTVVEPKKFVIETENATIQVDPSRSDLVEMKRIDG